MRKRPDARRADLGLRACRCVSQTLTREPVASTPQVLAALTGNIHPARFVPHVFSHSSKTPQEIQGMVSLGLLFHIREEFYKTTH